MKRKFTGIVAAILLAAIGTFALVAYVESAKDRAVADEAMVEAYVVNKTIPKGTPAEGIETSVEVVEVPARVLADDAVTDLSDLEGDLVAAVDLQAGEQLLRSRLVESGSLTRVDVPEGLQEVTVALDPARAVGGEIAAGDTVGVVMSFEPFDLPQTDDQSPNMTHLTFHKVLVTGVQFNQGEEATGSPIGSDDSGDEGEEEEVDRAPSSQLLVRLALSSPQVERVVFAAEFGHIWLTAENAAADESGTRVVTLAEVYGTAVPH